MNAIRSKRFLIVNPFGIGDVLFTTPIIEAIKAQSPDNYVGYVCNIRTAPLILSNPKVDKAFIFEKDEFRQIWKISKSRCIGKIFSLFKDIGREGFDAVFDLSLAREYGLLLMLAGIRERIGYDYRKRGLFLTKRIALPRAYENRHIAEYYEELLGLAGITPLDKPGLKIYIPQENEERSEEMLAAKGLRKDESFICVAPGGGASWGETSFRKQWPKEGFARVTKRLSGEKKIKIVLLGSSDDKPICDYIRSQCPECTDLCGETDLLTFAAIVRRAKLLVTNDGGPLHIAVACKTKTVSIFGPVDDKAYGPYPLGEGDIVVRNEGLECRPCYRNFKVPECTHIDCLNKVSDDAVIDAVERLL
ncbi:MAG: glycosyltransferase family 9 protein [Candidatus Omnitrophica bacterium]|nr:glycosyltransferase family 9 protein [Candidatus Omnitrophota bacterium]